LPPKAKRPSRSFESYYAWQYCVGKRLGMLIYNRKLRFLASSRLVLPALATLSNDLEKVSYGLAVSSSVLEPDGSFPAWTFGANFRA